MSAFHLIALLCLGIPWISVVSGNTCDITVDGFTWDFTVDVDVVIPGSDSADACHDECQQDAECKGYTWSLDEVVGSYCYKFKNITQDMHTCHDCTSGSIPDYLEGTCTSQFLEVKNTETLDECMKLCSDTSECNAYTWWNSSSIHPTACFLYETCQDRLQCEGCKSGQLNCITPFPSQCFTYKVLNEADRNIESAECIILITYNCKADNLTSRHDCTGVETSNGWKGPGIYRFMEPAGLMMSEFPIELTFCDSLHPIYLKGQHPEQIGVVVEMETNNKNITVTNCGDFYVYDLPEADCESRYCSTSSN